MRLGEIKQKIDRIISGEKIIVINNEAIYGGQAQKISNYSEIIEVLEYLSKLNWSDLNFDEITQNLLIDYPKGKSVEIITQEKFNMLNSYVTTVNKKLPIYYSILL